MTELVFILDRSGSMAGLENETVGGFNAMMEKQKKEEGKVLITTAFFNYSTVFIHHRVPLEHMQPLTEKDYYVGGGTALLDAVGNTLAEVETAQKNDAELPKKTLFVIITDGEENASCHYTYHAIKRKIKQKKEEGWDFLFLGANTDAVATAQQFGIDEQFAASYHSDAGGTRRNYEALEKVVEACCEKAEHFNLSYDWKDEIEAYAKQTKT